MTTQTTRETMTRYFDSGHADVSMMADDVVFTVMATGREHTGRFEMPALFKQLGVA